MIAVSQEGEQAGACLMSRVTVLIDCGSRGVAPVCSNDPSWFLHIAFFNYIKCSALVTANVGKHRLSLRIQERSIHYAHYIMHGKQRNTSLLWYQSRWLQQPTIFSWKKKKVQPTTLHQPTASANLWSADAAAPSLRCVGGCSAQYEERWCRDKALRDTRYSKGRTGN